MKRKNLMTGMLTVVLAGALCLGTIYTASFAGEKIRETETETETETESEIRLEHAAVEHRGVLHGG